MGYTIYSNSTQCHAKYNDIIPFATYIQCVCIMMSADIYSDAKNDVALFKTSHAQMCTSVLALSCLRYPFSCQISLSFLFLSRYESLAFYPLCHIINTLYSLLALLSCHYLDHVIFFIILNWVWFLWQSVISFSWHPCFECCYLYINE